MPLGYEQGFLSGDTRTSGLGTAKSSASSGGAFAGIGTAAVSGLFSAIGAWLMSDDKGEREEKRLEAMIMLDRERRRLPKFAFERLQGLLSGSVKPSGMGGGAFQRVLGGGGMGAPSPSGGGMQPRLGSQSSPMSPPQRNPQLRTFLGGRQNV